MTAELSDLRVVADYQFGAGAGAALFPPEGSVRVQRSTGGRPRQVLVDEGRLVSYGTDGRFTLGLAGGERLHRLLDPPTGRVVVGEESEPHVGEGRNAMAKFVHRVDPDVRPGDEVLVVGRDDALLAVARAELSAEAMRAFETGVAASVREGRRQR